LLMHNPPLKYPIEQVKQVVALRQVLHGALQGVHVVLD